MKRGNFSDEQRQVISEVEREYDFYRYKMLSKSKKYIYCKSNEISFYACIYEYFRYADNIAPVHIKACVKCSSEIISTLYHIYLKREYLAHHTWENIIEILDVLVSEQNPMDAA